MQASGGTINRVEHDNNEPIGFDDLRAFPLFDQEGTEIGVISAKGGDLIIVPVLPPPEEEEGVLVNTPATTHAEFGHEQPITEELAFLVTSLEDLKLEFREALSKPARDGFVNARWALKEVKRTKHQPDCGVSKLLAESHAGITYILTGEDAGTYMVMGFTETEEGEDEEMS
jgi:hypothetical protein